MPSRMIMGLVFGMLLQNSVVAQERSPSIWENRLGVQPPLLVATTATGPHAKQYPFRPETYGKTSGHSPTTNMSKACILIYTRQLNSATLPLASAINEFTLKHFSLDPAYLLLFDVKGAQRGGYTVEEMTARIKELEEISQKNKLTGVSIGIAANPAYAEKAGLNNINDVAIVLLKTPTSSRKEPVIAWYQMLSAKDLSAKTLSTLEADLEAVLKK
ncbi:MAG: hypothetical protein QM703_26890 [Gemmatales bacterium]